MELRGNLIKPEFKLNNSDKTVTFGFISVISVFFERTS